MIKRKLISYFPDDFFQKSVNEPFVQFLMANVLKEFSIKDGDANKFEPDFFCGKTPIEITLASDRNTKETFIKKLIYHEYTSQDVENDVFQFITESIEEKAGKKYSVDNVQLCVLCVLNLTNWVSEYYGYSFHHLYENRRKVYFEQLQQKYINSNKFSNIFIIHPDFNANWWVWDISSNVATGIKITDAMIINNKYPYIITKEKYDQILQPKQR